MGLCDASFGNEPFADPFDVVGYIKFWMLGCFGAIRWCLESAFNSHSVQAFSAPPLGFFVSMPSFLRFLAGTFWIADCDSYGR